MARVRGPQRDPLFLSWNGPQGGEEKATCRQDCWRKAIVTDHQLVTVSSGDKTVLVSAFSSQPCGREESIKAPFQLTDVEDGSAHQGLLAPVPRDRHIRLRCLEKRRLNLAIERTNLDSGASGVPVTVTQATQLFVYPRHGGLPGLHFPYGLMACLDIERSEPLRASPFTKFILGHRLMESV